MSLSHHTNGTSLADTRPWLGTGPLSLKVMPWAAGGANLVIQSRYFWIARCSGRAPNS